MGMDSRGAQESSSRSAVEFAALVAEVRGTPVVTVTGEIDLSSTPRFKTALSEAVPGGGAAERLVVDLNRVDFIDSTGLGVLIGKYRDLGATGRELRIVMVEGGPVSRILQMTGLENVLQTYTSREAALE